MTAFTIFTRCLTIVEVMATVAGFVTWKKWKYSYLKWFPVYLAAISLLAISYYSLKFFGRIDVGKQLMRLAAPLEIIFINFFFYHTLLPKHRKLIITGVILFIATWIIENLDISTKDYYLQSLSYTTGTLFILMYLVIFFIDLVKSKDVIEYKKLAVFWLALGMLIFYLGSFPFYGLYNELAKKANHNIYYPAAWVAMSFNYCMYIFFTIGFIWGKQR